jgi:uncharacterized membrane protein YjjP (DUF1212 family)
MAKYPNILLMEDRSKAEALLVELGRALHAAGASSGRVEAAVTEVAAGWGLPVDALATPTSLQLAFGAPGPQRLNLSRLQPGGIALGRLVTLEALVRRAAQGEGPQALRATLDRLHAQPAQWGALASLLAATVLGGAPGVELGAGVSLAVAALERLAQRRPAAARLTPLAGAALATLLSVLGARALGLPTAWPSLLGGLIQLAPGYTFTVAATELAESELVAGTARLGAALSTFLQLSVGLAATASALEAWPLLSPAGPAAAGVAWGAAAAVGLAYGVLLQAAPRDTRLVFLGALGGQAASELGDWIGSGAWAPFVAAAGLSLGSELAGRLTRRPSALFLVPSLLALVPGGAGIGGLSRVLHAEPGGGAAAIGAVVAAISLSTGVLLGQLLAGGLRGGARPPLDLSGERV